MVSIYSYAIDYIQKANDLNLSKHYRWQQLLHIKNGISEIDDQKFFLAKDGKKDAKSEMNATIYALMHEKVLDDNATACKFPARKHWLVEKLHMHDLPKVKCLEYQKILKKLDPVSATVVFPTAHINSPASMFGHTFLRINSSYHSKLLSYAINYAANADESKTNALLYALNGLVGGYHGFYSMLPYYEKLKEYRDTEQRDIWEYDLNLTKAEVLRMFEHIWELNGVYSDYYFFTENCSYNLLWLLEIGRKNLHLRDYFTYHVSPLETIHAMQDESMIVKEHYRGSKRTILLQYEKAIKEQYIHYVREILHKDIDVKKILDNGYIPLEQKQYLLEASIELLEYRYIQGKMTKDKYLNLFHTLTTARASLGRGKMLSKKKPINPLLSHRQARVTLGIQSKNNHESMLLAVRPVYHDVYDSNVGLLRGTQIEFLNTVLKIDKKVSIEEFTLLSIQSISQVSAFIKPFSWRTHFKWDRNYHTEKLFFNVDMGVGSSWGNEYGYGYIMGDIYAYLIDSVQGALGLSAGLVIDKSLQFKTNIELMKRWYTDGTKQSLVHFVQSYAISTNIQVKFEYKLKKSDFIEHSNSTYNLLFNYYF